MTQQTKQSKENYAENYNPYEHLKQSVRTEDGLPAYEPYIKDGNVVLSKDNKIVMVPRMHLDGDAYRDWFCKAFPNGRTEVIRHTSNSFVDGTGAIHCPPEVFEVKFYLNTTDQIPKSCGWGKASYKDNNQYDEISTAITLAFKNGMRNMGFGVDLDIQKVLEHLPRYIESSNEGKWAEYVPVQDKDIISSTELSAKECIAENNVLETMPSQVHEQNTSAVEICKTQTENVTLANDELVNSDLLAYIESKAAESEETNRFTTPSLNETIEPGISEDLERSNAETCIAAARDVVFEILPGVCGPLEKMAGMTMGEIMDSNPSLINMICKPTFRWEQKVTKDVYNAAQTLLSAK